MKIAHITDVEGNLAYFQHAVSLSPILTFDSTSNLQFTETNTCFVFGGDLIDKGVNDNELCRILVTFKRRHPHRVHLILGNRDLNKLRYAAELSDSDMQRDLHSIPKPHWDLSCPSILEYLTKLADQQSTTLDQVNTKTNRLRYMQVHTLGCQHTFDNRRIEMTNANPTHTTPTDAQVTENFLASVTDYNSCFFQFLSLGCIAVRLGDTLFVHGAVDAQTFGFLPDRDTKFEMPTAKSKGNHMESVNEWIVEMNAFLKAGLEDFKARPDWNHDRTSRGGEALMALQNRDAMWGRSVISNNFANGGCITTTKATHQRTIQYRKAAEENNPHAFAGTSSDPMDAKMVEWLLQSGVRRQVVGHKPSADAPACLAGSVTGVEVVSSDTSFSDTSATDNRGCAASSVLIVVNEETKTSYLIIQGMLRDGKEHYARFPMLGDGGGGGGGGSSGSSKSDTVLDEGNPHVGKTMEGDEEWWVQTMVGNQYRLVRGNGRQWEVKLLDHVRSSVSSLPK